MRGVGAGIYFGLSEIFRCGFDGNLYVADKEDRIWISLALLRVAWWKKRIACLYAKCYRDIIAPPLFFVLRYYQRCFSWRLRVFQRRESVASEHCHKQPRWAVWP